MAPPRQHHGVKRKAGRPRKVFEGARVADIEDEEDPPIQQQAEDGDVGSESDVGTVLNSDDGDSEDEAAPVQSYQSLLDAFGASKSRNDANHKRRKLNSHAVDSPNAAAVQPIGVTHAASDDEDEDDRGHGSQQYASAQEDQDSSAEETDDQTTDFFDLQFGKLNETDLSRRIKAAQSDVWDKQKVKFGGLGNALYAVPKGTAPDEQRHTHTAGKLFIKKKFAAFEARKARKGEPLSTALSSAVSRYSDCLFGNRTSTNATQFREAACLHALNHVFKTRDRVLRNTERLAKQDKNSTTEYRDQGFTRSKVLIVLPTKQSCVRYVNTILDVAQPDQQENKKRFEDGFVKDTDLGMERPDDYQELFEGDDDDSFRLGIKFTRKTVKFFSQFYQSDIIIASPLGLRRAIDRMDPKTKKKQDFDFLASIEIVVVDQADALLQQVWDHVEYIFSRLNQQPKDAHDCDFSRVRNWYLDGNAAYLRQTLVFSAFITPELNTLFSKNMRNCFGKIRYAPEYQGAVQDISTTTGLSIRQTFLRLNSASPAMDPDARFKYFQASIVPLITRYPKPPDGAHGILIFIPSYFDFVRIRNYFATSPTVAHLSFGAISENNTPEQPEIRRARSHFISGRHSVLLYSGRAHHFYRYKIKGVKKVIMYSLPDNPIFYEEVVGGFLGASVQYGKIADHEASARAMFSKWDVLKLERTVGTARVGALLREKAGDTFDFR